MSDVTSTGRHGKTCRQDVLRRADIPVVEGAAGRAAPRPGAKRQFGEQMPAHRASLGAGVPAVDHCHMTAVSGRFVLQHRAECAPARVKDRLGKPPIADHALDMQILDDDQVMIADRTRAGLVQEVSAGCAHLTVSSGDLLHPVRGDREVSDAEVETDCRASRRSLIGSLHLDGERDVPATTRIARHCHRRRTDRRTCGSVPPPAGGWGRPASCKPYACSKYRRIATRLGSDERHGLLVFSADPA